MEKKLTLSTASRAAESRTVNALVGLLGQPVRKGNDEDMDMQDVHGTLAGWIGGGRVRRDAGRGGRTVERRVAGARPSRGCQAGRHAGVPE